MADTFSLDSKTVENLVLQAVQNNILLAVENISQDSVWLAKIEQMINQAVVQETIARIGSMDINSIIKQRVDENIEKFHAQLKKDFSSVGISDQATQNQMTVMDDYTVFENTLTSRNLQVADSAQIQNLVVTGSINTDNQSWVSLIADLGEKILNRISEEWREQLVAQVALKIKDQGIDFDQINLNGEPLIDGNRLNSQVTQTNIQKLGVLSDLKVSGEAHVNDTVHVVRNRVGINTEEPEQALSVWDEEVSINLGKYKQNTAFVGTGRAQALSIGVNRTAQIEIDTTGMTQIKKLRVGVYQISHDTQVPGWSGTKGDIVFNTNFGNDRVFAWICLGNFKWQPLKTAE